MRLKRITIGEGNGMNFISREELKEKLDRGDDFKLVMALGDWAFRASHIPGSINLSHMNDVESLIDEQDEIVVYCSDPTCIASQAAYNFLTKKGFKNVRRFAGGLAEWEAAGYPLEGEGL
jgi:rhodanese-related sulfurtransferase